MKSDICLITVKGRMSQRIIDNTGLSDFVSEEDNHVVTRLSGPVMDQAALMGILNSLYDMGYTILSVEYPSSIKENIIN